MSKPKQEELFQAQTTWFHVFKAMVDNGDVAKLGPYAVTVYLVIKSHTNYATGRAFPSVETIQEFIRMRLLMRIVMYGGPSVLMQK